MISDSVLTDFQGTCELNSASPERIIDNLMLLHEEAIRYGAQTLAITIPEHSQVS